MTDPHDDPLLLVSFGEAGPLRCTRCRAYVNPFMRWVENGRRFVCNFCQMVCECPPDYYSPIGPDGKRRDWLERAELCRGSVEFVAPQASAARARSHGGGRPPNPCRLRRTTWCGRPCPPCTSS